MYTTVSKGPGPQIGEHFPDHVLKGRQSYFNILHLFNVYSAPEDRPECVVSIHREIASDWVKWSYLPTNITNCKDPY